MQVPTRRQRPQARTLVLDSRDLEIRSVSLLPKKGEPQTLGFRLGEAHHDALHSVRKGAAAMTNVGVHTEHEDQPWTIEVGDHPGRTDSPQYTRSRNLMIKLVQQTQPW